MKSLFTFCIICVIRKCYLMTILMKINWFLTLCSTGGRPDETSSTRLVRHACPGSYTPAPARGTARRDDVTQRPEVWLIVFGSVGSALSGRPVARRDQQIVWTQVWFHWLHMPQVSPTFESRSVFGLPTLSPLCLSLFFVS